MGAYQAKACSEPVPIRGCKRPSTSYRLEPQEVLAQDWQQTPMTDSLLISSPTTRKASRSCSYFWQKYRNTEDSFYGEM